MKSKMLQGLRSVFGFCSLSRIHWKYSRKEYAATPSCMRLLPGRLMGSMAGRVETLSAPRLVERK
jgi:hypothetical protein